MDLTCGGAFGCLDDPSILRFIAGELTGAERGAALDHVDRCVDCRVLLAETAKSAFRAAEAAAPARLDRDGRIGERYVLLDVVGAGAMGIVYAAFDAKLDRKVALKILRSGDALPRLAREAKSMARQSHPNLVTVYDVSSNPGEPYLAMEFVAGLSAADWVRASARTPRAVLDVYRQAARGLAAIHAHGLVHRDFKPENVLVREDGTALVTDFGLARPTAVDRGEGTERAGTRAYMSPEQLRGEDATPRSDQFSLCVSLYEALEGARPFRGSSEDELLAAIERGRCDVRAAVPRSVRRAIARGLAFLPEDRFSSIAELEGALGIERSRRRFAGALAAIALVGLLVGRISARPAASPCAGRDSRLAGIWDETQKAAIHRAFVSTGAPYAESAYAASARLLDDYARTWLEMDRASCEALHVRSDPAGPLDDLDNRAQCLAVRRERFAALTALFHEGDASTVERAVDASRSLLPVDGCARHATTRAGAPEGRRRGNQRDESFAVERELARVDVLERAGRFQEARSAAEPTLAKARALGAPAITAKALLSLGRVSGRLDAPNTEAILLDAVTTAEGAGDDDVVARAFVTLASEIGFHHARYEHGLEWCRHAEAALTRLGGDDIVEADLLQTRGSLLWKSGRLDDAIAPLQRSRELREARYGRGSAAVASVLVAIARVVSDRSEPSEALRLDAEALAAFERELGPNHPSCGTILSNMAFESLVVGRTDDAVAFATRAASIYESTLGPAHRKLALPLDNLGAALMARGDHAGALAAYERARGIIEKTKNVDDPMLGTLANDEAIALTRLGRIDDAIAHAKDAIARRERLFGPQHLDVGVARSTLAEALDAQGAKERAVAEGERALGIVERAAGLDSPTRAEVLSILGNAELRAGRRVTAIAHLESAVRLREHHAWDPDGLARARRDLDAATRTR